MAKFVKKIKNGQIFFSMAKLSENGQINGQICENGHFFSMADQHKKWPNFRSWQPWSFVHNYFSKKLLPVFDDYYSTLAEQHQINTRNGQYLLDIPDHNTNIAAKSIKISGAKLWNNLENNFKNIPKVKSYLAFYLFWL